MRHLISIDSLEYNNDNIILGYKSYIFTCSKCGLIHRGSLPKYDGSILDIEPSTRQTCYNCYSSVRKSISRLKGNSHCPCEYCKVRIKSQK